MRVTTVPGSRPSPAHHLAAQSPLPLADRRVSLIVAAGTQTQKDRKVFHKQIPQRGEPAARGRGKEEAGEAQE